MPPAPPATMQETGLHPDTLAQLLLKTLVGGEASGTGLADKLRLPVFGSRRADPARARREAARGARRRRRRQCAGYRYALTDLGRDRAMQFFDVSRYVGPAPVPLAQYNAYVRACMAARPFVDTERLATGFEHLIVSKGMFDQLGPAVNSGKSLFLYGAPGNGKTVVAEGIGRALGETMHIPHAIDVDGQTITMYDPVNHRSSRRRRARRASSPARSTTAGGKRIRRPVVVVGGELTLEMLDLTFNPISKFYEAPIQMKANGGVFVVDDFGRQRIPPRDLLNRWIVPLESRVDFLTLHTGRKFEVPFNVLIVFATNLKPESLADEAFLRRIPYKILAKNPTMDEYCRIFELNCKRRGTDVRSGDGGVPAPEVLPAAQDSRCAPAIHAICSSRSSTSAAIRGKTPTITRELLDAACGSYFLEESDSQGSQVKRETGALRFAEAEARPERPRCRRSSSGDAGQRARTAGSGRPGRQGRHRCAVHDDGRASRARLPRDRAA